MYSLKIYDNIKDKVINEKIISFLEKYNLFTLELGIYHLFIYLMQNLLSFIYTPTTYPILI